MIVAQDAALVGLEHGLPWFLPTEAMQRVRFGRMIGWQTDFGFLPAKPSLIDPVAKGHQRKTGGIQRIAASGQAFSINPHAIQRRVFTDDIGHRGIAVEITVPSLGFVRGIAHIHQSARSELCVGIRGPGFPIPGPEITAHNRPGLQPRSFHGVVNGSVKSLANSARAAGAVSLGILSDRMPSSGASRSWL